MPDLSGAAFEEAAELVSTGRPATVTASGTSGTTRAFRFARGRSRRRPRRERGSAPPRGRARRRRSRAARAPSASRPADPGPLEGAPECARLTVVAETGNAFSGRETAEHPADRVCTPDRDDLGSLGLQVVAAAPGRHLERRFVARPFDENEPVDVRRNLHRPSPRSSGPRTPLPWMPPYSPIRACPGAGHGTRPERRVGQSSACPFSSSC